MKRVLQVQPSFGLRISNLCMMAALLLCLIACSSPEFKIDPNSKTEILSKTNVFGDEGIEPVGGDGDGGKNPVGGDGKASTGAIGVLNVCSDDGYMETEGKTVTTSTEVKVLIRESSRMNSSIVCTIENVKSQILNKREIDLSSCALPLNKYYIDLMPSDAQTSLVYRGDRYGSVMEKKGSGWKVTSSKSGKIQALIDQNFERDDVAGDDNENCEDHQSPLVINMTPQGEKDRGLQLSSPERGIEFDLLGENQVRAHEKVKISWPKNSHYMFLTLPNSNGEILGINQLFGNNTRGPDGKFASDGYAALAKHDLNMDHVIDEKDSVFDELALWSDRNRNGLAERNELYSLSQAQIKSIDLNYDASFFEEDKYGNQSRMKSVVERRNGSLNIIFDLWFIVK